VYDDDEPQGKPAELCARERFINLFAAERDSAPIPLAGDDDDRQLPHAFWPSWTDYFVWEPTEPEEEPAIAAAPPELGEPDVPTPTDGKALWSWLQRMGSRHGIGILRPTLTWGQGRGFARRMVDWSPDQVRVAHARAADTLTRVHNLQSQYHAAFYAAKARESAR
jgi:hypothetical protein